MTESQSEEKEKSMTEPSLDTDVSFPAGSSLELTIREVNEVIKHFISTNGIIDLPSWKYPHISLEKIDIESIIDDFSKRDSNNRRYMNLLELLIDRLWYSVLVSSKFVNILFNIIGSTEEDHQIDMCLQTVDPLPTKIDIFSSKLRVNRPNYQDTSKNTNIALNLRQLHTKLFALEDLLQCILEKNCIVEEDEQIVNESSLLNGISEICKISSPLVEVELSFKESQTEVISLTTCEACWMAMNCLKKIGDIVASLTMEEAEVSRTKILIQDLVWSTQWSIVKGWLHTLKTDCKTIVEHMKKTSLKNSVWEEQYKTTRNDIKRQIRDHKALDIKLKTVLEKLEKTEKKNSTTEKDKKIAEEKSVELELAFAEHEKECEARAQERAKLDQDFIALETLTQELWFSKSQSTSNLSKMRANLENEVKENSVLKDQMVNMKEQIEKFYLDANQKKQNVQDENKKIEIEQEAKYIAEIDRLKESLEKAETNMELMQFYPDLNGPLTTNEDKGNPVETMEKQLKTNNLRINILNSQNYRLRTTVDRMKSLNLEKSFNSI